MRRVLDVHVGCQHVRQPTHFAPAHGVGLSRQRERPRAGFANSPGRQMAIDDRVDFIGARRRLIDALAVGGDAAWRFREKVVESADISCFEPRRLGDAGQRRGLSRCRRFIEPLRMPLNVRSIERAGRGEMREQSIEQRHIRPRRERQMQISQLARRRAPGIDHHDFGTAHLARRRQPLVEYRMAPREIRADQHHQIGQLEILVGAGHRVRAERAPVPRHRRRHAQPRIGVDVGRADEPFHQLVGDIVVLGQQLAGDVERDRVWPMFGDGRGEGARDSIQCGVPTHLGTIDQGMQQPVFGAQRFGQRGTLGAQPPAIGRMIRIAADRHGTGRITARDHAAADTAVRTGAADRGLSHGAMVSRTIPPRRGTAATVTGTSIFGDATGANAGPKTSPSRKADISAPD